MFCLEPISCIFSGIVGFLLGIMYFYGAYHTAMTLHSQKEPMAVLMGSFVGRTLFVGFVFYLTFGGYADRLFILFISFFVGRFIFMKKIMVKLDKKYAKDKGVLAETLENVNSLHNIKR